MKEKLQALLAAGMRKLSFTFKNREGEVESREVMAMDIISKASDPTVEYLWAIELKGPEAGTPKAFSLKGIRKTGLAATGGVKYNIAPPRWARVAA